MTYEYLEETRSGRANANGDVTVSLGPIGSQWWAPAYIRVTTNSTAIGRCTVYRGPSGLLDGTTYVDDTVIPNDMTSIIAGQIVQSRTVITAVWSGLLPNSVVVLSVFGRRSDLPPSQGEVIPEIPGARFSGGSTLVPNSRSLLSVSDPDIDATEFLGSFYVGDSDHIGVDFVAVTNHFEVLFEFGTVPGPGIGVLSTSEISVRGGSRFNQSIPVVSSWVKITIIPVLPNSSYIMEVWTAPKPFKAVNFGNAYGIVFSRTETVATGVTETHQGTWVTPGEAHWSADTNAALNAIVIESVDHDGTVRLIDRANSMLVPARQIYLPATDIQVRMFNGDGANRVFTVSVVMRPIQPGQ